MFGSVGWGELLVLLVVGLVVLGPERLPGAIQWTTESLRKVRDYASGATASLREELGPEFDDVRKPLAELQKLRGMTPRAVITKHLLDGDDSVLDSLTKPLEDVKKAVSEPAPTPVANPDLTKPGDPGPTRYDADAT
ncbi:Sec-independent protein translocase protein TatB [Mycobacteroides chelonae]|jgi:sec-independent protein translocase protein TatB|uniref:Sec-independent protein translocase protein TatB n=1 Tax=Mycobacteroides chelonae TaxID=1774 RepID=A0A1S1M3I1_MYCCH|nr:Sec-independent protein translocase protein TatB [Mycobacteroides chelonae]OHU23769.1 twin arginine-targeting protein translocase TatB [Mycobacteroides chelonae]OHU64411.1 twin arginine-targeting protein translocase TatB [Mycobacteroides chelonae]OHU71019.1 twin arginine-targeting protein translocase TatB [Mycobacteroides chelonae]OHU77846.1 twin arginine-targeting protein translocase TatB [Mycobacteroides chelonae]QQG86984.1 Sec-independent protein translocase subunit TatB [Mycobacteroides